MSDHQLDLDQAVLEEEATSLDEPPRFRVLLHNDDFTTMDFVVYVLVQVFHRSEDDAFRLMIQVHSQGVGLAGIYTHEIAETKVAQTIGLARAHEFPLLCTMEEA